MSQPRLVPWTQTHTIRWFGPGEHYENPKPGSIFLVATPGTVACGSKPAPRAFSVTQPQLEFIIKAKAAHLPTCNRAQSAAKPVEGTTNEQAGIHPHCTEWRGKNVGVPR